MDVSPYGSSGPLRVVGMGGSRRPQSISRLALRHALEAELAAGVQTEMSSLRDWDLPPFQPNWAVDDYDATVTDYLSVIRRADVLLISSPAYHGTVAGHVKNALDLLELLGDEEPPYLSGTVVGLIAVSGGDSAGVQTLTAMMHAAHALRALVVPRQVFIPRASEARGDDGRLRTPWPSRLAALARDAVALGRRLQAVPKHH